MARPNRHPHRVAVFSYDSDPNREQPCYHISRNRADEMVSEGTAFWLAALRPTIQRIPPMEYVSDARNYVTAGTMRDAWQIRESAGFLVLQMKTQETCA